MKLNRKGFTLVEIMIVVAIIALLAAIAIPSFMKSRTEARKSACVNNLRLIDHAKQQYATADSTVTESTDCDTVPHKAAVESYLKGVPPTCPSGGTYTYGLVSTNPICSTGGQHLLSR